MYLISWYIWLVLSIFHWFLFWNRQRFMLGFPKLFGLWFILFFLAVNLHRIFYCWLFDRFDYWLKISALISFLVHFVSFLANHLALDSIIKSSGFSWFWSIQFWIIVTKSGYKSMVVLCYWMHNLNIFMFIFDLATRIFSLQNFRVFFLLCLCLCAETWFILCIWDWFFRKFFCRRGMLNYLFAFHLPRIFFYRVYHRSIDPRTRILCYFNIDCGWGLLIFFLFTW